MILQQCKLTNLMRQTVSTFQNPGRRQDRPQKSRGLKHAKVTKLLELVFQLKMSTDRKH